MMKTTKTWLIAGFLACASCDIDVGDLNNVALDDLLKNPTPLVVFTATTGLLIGNRGNYAAQNGYISLLGILGRESYVFAPSDPAYVDQMLAAAALNAGSPAFGGNFWVLPYRNIRNGNHVLTAVDIVPRVDEPDKEAIRGFAKTIMALDYMTILVTRDSNGGVIQIGDGINDPLDPIVSKAALQDYIAQLLDEGKAHLQGAGETFPFVLSSGYAAFRRPADFIKFNRAIKARFHIYRAHPVDPSIYPDPAVAGELQRALTALGESFLDENAPFSLGAYHAFSGISGDELNGLTSAAILVHPDVVAQAEANDARVAAKIKRLAKPATWPGKLTSQYGFTLYDQPDDPAPIIRNEELVLLRAEASIGLGGAANLAEGRRLINLVRARSGGLGPSPVADNQLLDELLTQKRYSLLFEGGHRWIDTRGYGKFGELTLDKPDHRVHRVFPIPVDETNPR